MWCKATFSAAITPVFSVTWLFLNIISLEDWKHYILEETMGFSRFLWLIESLNEHLFKMEIVKLYITLMWLLTSLMCSFWIKVLLKKTNLLNGSVSPVIS